MAGNIDEQQVAASARWVSQLGMPLQVEDLPLDTPLPARVLDADGTLLLDAGALLDATRRAQLFQYFRPYGQYALAKDGLDAVPQATVSTYGNEFVEPSDADAGDASPAPTTSTSTDVAQPSDAAQPGGVASGSALEGAPSERKGAAPNGPVPPGGRTTAVSAGPGATSQPDDDAAKAPVEISEMGLSIGNRLGIRLPMGAGRIAYASRLIGVAPHGPLLVMPPTLNQSRLTLSVGETVEVVAVCPRSIYLFTCTVDWLASMPFQYIVLSAPARIRTLRERGAIRSTSRLAVLYTPSGARADEPIDDTRAGDVVKPGLGVAIDISTAGMLLAADAPLGEVGDRMKILFYVEAEGVPIAVDVECDIRSITQRKPARVPSGEWVHGLSFGPLPPTQRLVLKTYVLDRRIDHDRN